MKMFASMHPSAMIGAKVALVLSLFVGVLLGAGVTPAFAELITLSDMNSVVTIDPTSQAGMNQWTLDGVNQLYQQWFWYRVGATGPEASIDTLGAPIVTQSTPDSATGSYSGDGLKIEVKYTLTGGSTNSGTADIAETIRITNTDTVATKAVHFFQYSNFDLLGNGIGDTVRFSNENTVNQQDGGVTLSEGVMDGAEVVDGLQTVITPTPNHREAAWFSTTRDKLSDIVPTTLSDTPIGVSVGPGNVTWAFQWDRTLKPGVSLIISKDKLLSGITPVPEPATLVLLGLGTCGLLAFAWRRRRS